MTHTIIGIKDKPDYITSPKLEINRSPQDFVNSYILDNIGIFKFENFYGNPQNFLVLSKFSFHHLN